MRIFLTSSATFMSLTGSLAAALAVRTTSDLICGQNGWDAGHESYFSQTDGYVNTIAGCSAKCNADKTCVSFAIGPNDCELYDVPAKGNFAADSSSPFAFYDKSCPQLSQQCGVAGYSKMDSYYYSKGLESKTDCQNDCNDLPSCASWAYGNGECFNFEENIGNNVDVDPSSPYLYYDKACDLSSSTTTTTTAKTTKTSTKTTAKTTTTTTTTTTTSTKKSISTTLSSTVKSTSTTNSVGKSTTASTTSQKASATTTKSTSCTTTKATTTSAKTTKTTCITTTR